MTAKKKITSQDKYSELAVKVADIFIKALEENTLPWNSGFVKHQFLPAFNPVTGTQYSGMNALTLPLQALMRGYTDPRFMTFNNAKELGGTVRKGEHAFVGFNFKPVQVLKKDENGEPVLDAEGNKIYQEMVFPKQFLVFNVEQIDGLNLPKLEELKQPEFNWTPIERAENLLKASGAKIKITEACQTPNYAPMIDRIELPTREQYKTAEGFYSTALHELSHWTGHPSRLDRDILNGFGTQKYAREELRAEIGSSILCMSLGISPSIDDNHKAYVKSWIQELKNEPKEILKACSDAEKIHDFIMDFDPQYKLEKEAMKKALLDTTTKIAPAELPAAKEESVSEINDRQTVSIEEFFKSYDKEEKFKEDMFREAVSIEYDEVRQDLNRTFNNHYSTPWHEKHFPNLYKDTVEAQKKGQPFITIESILVKDRENRVAIPDNFDDYLFCHKSKSGYNCAMFDGSIEFKGLYKNKPFTLTLDGYGDFLKTQVNTEKTSKNIVKALESQKTTLYEVARILKSEDLDSFLPYPKGTFEDKYNKFIQFKEDCLQRNQRSSKEIAR